MKCPVCRVDNTEGPNCRRCRADLSLLFALDRQRSERLNEALQQARAGAWRAALLLAMEAHTMRQGEDTARLLAMCRLMLRDFAGAWQEYRTSQQKP